MELRSIPIKTSVQIGKLKFKSHSIKLSHTSHTVIHPLIIGYKNIEKSLLYKASSPESKL
jgi:hypothetical protein